jgi:hypothetical protein
LAVYLGSESRVETELDTGKVEQLRPQGTGENQIPVTDYGTWKPMEAYNVVEATVRAV